MSASPPPVVRVSTLIVGAGPAGLAVAAGLAARGRPYTIVERGARVAESWHHHYDRLCLHTVKELSALPGLGFPEHYPRYVPREQLAAYYGAYATHHGIEPRFGVEVTAILRSGSGWRVEVAEGAAFDADAVVLATGVNRVPVRPTFRGESSFQGTIEHSRSYRRPDPYRGRRVLIVGMGNTGAEIALDLCDAGVDVALSVRGPVNIVPREVWGRPTQRTAILLGRLPEGLGDRLGVLLRRLTVGDLSRWGIRTPALPPVRQLRLQGKTPVIDLGTVAHIRAGRIPVHGAVDRFVPEGVTFQGGRTAPFDAVLLATGYRPGVESFFADTDGLLDRNGLPGFVVGTGRWEGLFLVGFDAYQPGGVLRTIVGQSRAVVEALDARGVV